MRRTAWTVLFLFGAGAATADTLKLVDGYVVTGEVVQVMGSIVELRQGKRTTFIGLNTLDPVDRRRLEGSAGAGEQTAGPGSSPASSTAPAATGVTAPSTPSAMMHYIMSKEPRELSLARALYEDNQDLVIGVLKADPSFANARGWEDPCALCEAIDKNMDEAAALMIKLGADVSATGGNGRTPLHWAALKGKTALADQLIAQGARVNVADGKGSTPLHLAALWGHLDTVRLLVAKGASVNAKDEDGLSPLHCAAGIGHRKSFTGYPLSRPMCAGHPETVGFLLESGADPNARDSENCTPLHVAAGSGNPQSVQLMLATNADVKACDNGNFTPLHHAAKTGSVEVARLLLAAGAEVNAPGGLEGTTLIEGTALHIAAGEGFKVMVTFLLDNGADVNARDKGRPDRRRNFNIPGDKTPLHHAVNNRQNDIAELLILRGADVNAQDNAGATPVSEAIQQHYTRVEPVKLTDTLQMLADHGADLNKAMADGNTPLHLAVTRERGSEGGEAVKFLLEKKVGVNPVNAEGYTPLCLAVNNGSPAFYMILEAGGDVAIPNGWGLTPMHLAAGRLDAQMVRLLKERGADVNAKDNDGNTPLHLMARGNRADIVRVLLSLGADPNIPNNKGQLPFDIAMPGKSYKPDVVKLLQPSQPPSPATTPGE